ncbi:MAG: Lrp/AsnC family transcriptional regulator [Mucispirillum sp.]|nr:Lrp/AsnC family transcriptional regulator [Mucispirillum sp.]
MSLDSIDERILNMLIENGRVSYTDIAKEVGMKSPSVIDRIKKMESDGIIYDYTARVDYRKLGYDMAAFIGVVMDNPVYIDNFEHMLSSVDDDIVECYHVTGDFTLLLKVITKNTNTLAGVIRKLRELPGVASTNTILIFSSMIERVHKV